MWEVEVPYGWPNWETYSVYCCLNSGRNAGLSFLDDVLHDAAESAVDKLGFGGNFVKEKNNILILHLADALAGSIDSLLLAPSKMNSSPLHDNRYMNLSDYSAGFKGNLISDILCQVDWENLADYYYGDFYIKMEEIVSDRSENKTSVIDQMKSLDVFPSEHAWSCKQEGKGRYGIQRS